MDKIYVNYGYEEILTFWHLQLVYFDYSILQRVKMATIYGVKFMILLNYAS